MSEKDKGCCGMPNTHHRIFIKGSSQSGGHAIYATSNHKWLMVYHDHLTKFRPLTSKQAVEVAHHLSFPFIW